MLQAAIISNEIEGLKASFLSDEQINCTFLPITADFEPQLDAFDVLILPNGSDHVALYRIKDKIAAFLAQGKTLLCFDGWFTNWLPGNQWVMDNSKKTIDVRYALKADPYDFFEGINLQELIFSHGISGWWACGYIEPAPQATVILEDTWGRAMMILDEATTNGRIIATASGPLGDYAYATTDDDEAMRALTGVYRNIVANFLIA